MSRLESWKDAPRRKPLLLHGARQVGKTWLLRAFGRRHFDNVAYINFDGNPTTQTLFEQGYDLPQLLQGLQLSAGEPIIPGKTLLILDEVQACPKALTSLKYFNEERPDLAVAAAGSLLGLTVHEGTGFPVGKVNSFNLHPLTFWEYLDAMDEQPLREVLSSGDTRLMTAFAARLTAHLRNYLYVGGMPEAVAAFADTHDYKTVRAIQTDILRGYELDLSKYMGARKLEAALAIFHAIPAQLSKENKRLVFGQVREGARARDFAFALTWLEQAGIVVLVSRVQKPGLPLGSYAAPDERRRAFKLFLVDVGLLGAMADLSARTIVEGSTIFEEFKGALTEQYVCEQLVAGCALQPYYWTNERSSAEIDFVVQQNGTIYGMEVRAAENLRSKSLRSFHDRYPEARCVRFSLSGYRTQDWLVNVPLFAVQNEKLWEACAPPASE